MNSYNDYMNSYVYEFIYMNSYDFFIYEFICFMNSYMNSGVPRFQMSGLIKFTCKFKLPA